MTYTPELTRQKKVTLTHFHKEKEYDENHSISCCCQKEPQDKLNRLIGDLNRQLQKPEPIVKGWHKLAFVMMGIASLAGWNAILSALDFFKAQYPKQEFLDVTLYFPIPIMITNFLGAFACPAIARHFTITQRIAKSFMGCCFTMISVTLIAIFFNTQLGFWISFGLLFVQGFIDSINTSSLISLAGMLHPSLNRIYWTCTALSGLTTNVLRMFALGILGDGEYSVNTGSALYFSIAAFVYVLSSTLQVLFTNSEYFFIILQRQQIYTKLEQIKKSSKLDLQKMQTTQAFSQVEIEIQTHPKQSSFKCIKDIAFVKYLIELATVFKYAGAIPLFISLNYIQTFMVFPSVSIYQKTTFQLIKFPWAPVIMITMFNIGDIIGKYLGSFKAMHRLYLAYSIVLLRFVNFAFFMITARQQNLDFFQNDIFAIFNMFIFALTNGLSTTSLIYLGPKNHTDPKVIDLINYVGGLSIAFGIMIGTFLALLLDSN